MATALSDYEDNDTNQSSMTQHRRQRACIEFSRVNANTHPLNITLERDFVRIHFGKYFMCVKDVIFKVRRVHRGCGSGAAILSDVDVVLEDDFTLQTFTEIEEKIRDHFDSDASIKHRFPDLEGRMLMNRVSTNKVVVTRLRFLDSKPASVSQMLLNIKSEDRVRANIALMGVKHVRGEVFPVWRVISGSIMIEPECDATPEDEWPGEIVDGNDEKIIEKECDEHDDVASIEDNIVDNNNNNIAPCDDDGKVEIVDIPRKPTKSKVKLQSKDRELIMSSLRNDLMRDIETRFSQMSGGGDHLQNKMET
jgi:hypothetical protein